MLERIRTYLNHKGFKYSTVQDENQCPVITFKYSLRSTVFDCFMEIFDDGVVRFFIYAPNQVESHRQDEILKVLNFINTSLVNVSDSMPDTNSSS